ncbi:BnaA07g36700D [Brassica napus]|uniref:BnaA07g36700D protein n=3 Tax=Brassica TaxID=3705 RepID=A0A078JV80_BRANA|nr:BnaA07g36700D [Brassica napus]
MASLSPSSHGLKILGYEIGRVMIEGVLICSTNGTANPVSNATVFLTCGGSTISLAEAVTDLYDAFTIVLNIIQTLLFDPSFCGIGTNLPNGGCGVEFPDDVVYATLSLVGIGQTNNIFTAFYRAGPFS